MEKLLWEVLDSERGETKNWLRWRLIVRGVESRFATILARRKAANSDLLKLDPKEMNRFFYSLIEEYEEAGFDEKIALSTLGKLRKLKKLGLPVNANTISRNPKNPAEKQRRVRKIGIASK
jgi:hypothetical protein